MAVKKARKLVVSIGTNTTALGSESSWTVIEQCRVASGSLGVNWSTADGTTFDDEFRQNYKTVKDGGDMELVMLRDWTKTGQNALQTAAATKEDAAYNFKIELDDDAAGGSNAPTTLKFQARVLSFAGAPGNVSSLVEWKAKLDITGASTEVAAT